MEIPLSLIPVNPNDVIPSEPIPVNFINFRRDNPFLLPNGSVSITQFLLVCLFIFNGQNLRMWKIFFTAKVAIPKFRDRKGRKVIFLNINSLRSLRF